jgi:hypothetical protein
MVSVTGIVFADGVAPGAMMVTAPVYVPADRADGSAVTCKVKGIVPEDGVRVSQGTFAEVVNAKPGTVDERVIACPLVIAPPAVAEKVRDAGVTWYVTVPASTSRMRLLSASAMSKLPEASNASE